MLYKRQFNGKYYNLLNCGTEQVKKFLDGNILSGFKLAIILKV